MKSNIFKRLAIVSLALFQSSNVLASAQHDAEMHGQPQQDNISCPRLSAEDANEILIQIRAKQKWNGWNLIIDNPNKDTFSDMIVGAVIFKQERIGSNIKACSYKIKYVLKTEPQGAGQAIEKEFEVTLLKKLNHSDSHKPSNSNK